MNDVDQEVTTAIEIEHASRVHFSYDFKVKQIIANDLETLKGSRTTVFETTDHKILAFCTSEESLELGDVKHIIRGMGLEASYYLPPAQYHGYFINYGKQAFASAFPGRQITSNDNLSFYESLAPYNPALIKVHTIPDGVYGYIPALGKWYKAIDVTYKSEG
jgi:hypothetical protein